MNRTVRAKEIERPPAPEEDMQRVAIRLTIFSLMIGLLAIGFAGAVTHESRGVLPYQSGVVFR